VHLVGRKKDGFARQRSPRSKDARIGKEDAPSIIEKDVSSKLKPEAERANRDRGKSEITEKDDQRGKRVGNIRTMPRNAYYQYRENGRASTIEGWRGTCGVILTSLREHELK